MATVIDLLRQVGRQAGPDGCQAFVGPLAVVGQVKPTLTLDLPRSVTSAWTAATGRSTTAQHAVALAASRAGQPIAFVGSGACPHEDSLLLLLGRLADQPAMSALWLVPDKEAARASVELLQSVASSVNLTWQSVGAQPSRSDQVQVVVATFDQLHSRLLHFADRAWRWFWQRLDLVVASDLHQAGGLRANHLGWLIRRIERLVERDLRVIGALAPVEDAEEVLRTIFERDVRLVDSGSRAAETTLVALWRGRDRLADLMRLVETFQARSIPVAVLGQDRRETDGLRARIGPESSNHIGLTPATARIGIVAGIPARGPLRNALLHAGYRLLVMLAGDEPHELFFATDLERILVDVPGHSVTMLNPYVANCHLLSAAAELPLTVAEVRGWQVGDLVERLLEKRRLAPLGDDLLHPGKAAPEYEDTLLAATLGRQPVPVRGPDGALLEYLSPSVAEWRGLPGTTWGPGVVVANRNEDPPGIDLAVDDRPRYAYPMLTLSITPREDLAARDVGGLGGVASRSKVDVHQRVDGFREHLHGRAPAVLRVSQRPEHRWVALACAIRLPVAPPDPVSAGWSVRAALALLTQLRPEEALVFYETGARSLWILETEGGGTGASEYLFGKLERLLETACALSRACVSSPVYGAVAQSELPWLEGLLGRSPDDVVDAADGTKERTIEPRGAMHLRQGSREPARRTRIYRSSEAPPRVPPGAEPQRAVVGRQAPTPDSSAEVVQDVPQDESPTGIEDAAIHEPEAGVGKPAPAQMVFDKTSLQASHSVGEGEAVDMGYPRNGSLRAEDPESAVDDIRWEPEPKRGATSAQLDFLTTTDQDAQGANPVETSVDSSSPLNEPVVPDDTVPPLGREAVTPLNSPRRPSRYPDHPRQPPRTDQPVRRSVKSPAQSNAADRGAQRPRPFSDTGRRDVPDEGGREAPTHREQVVDVGAMIARMRRMREERERSQAPLVPPQALAPAEPVTLRFHPGQRVTCVPYGEGVVRAAQVVAGREQLTIAFPEHGSLEVDPAVNAVRLLDEEPSTSVDDAEELD